MAEQIQNPPPARRIDQGGQSQGIEAANHEADQNHGQPGPGGGQGSGGNAGFTEGQGSGGQAGPTQGSNQGQNAAGQRKTAGNA